MPTEFAPTASSNQAVIERALDRSRGFGARPNEVRLRLSDGSERVGRVMLPLEEFILFVPTGHSLFGRAPVEIPYGAIASVAAWRYHADRLSACFAVLAALISVSLDRSSLWLGSPTMRADFGLPWSERTSLILVISATAAGLVTLALSGSRFGRRWVEVSDTPDA